ncbi:hypothetical protein BDZ89DRAFT_1065834 [Hymenopellis radicata]|nr:hypothetical protein BDZ89DRAFT_1065834 [Hymenopellis radicata]
MALPLSKEDAQTIVDTHHKSKLTVVTVSHVGNNGFSRTKSSKIYIIDLAASASDAATHSTYITVFSPGPSDTPYHSNSLEVTAHIISLISKSHTIPISNPHVDASRDIIPFPYLMTPVEKITSSMMMSLSDLRKLNILTPKESVLIDIQLGQFLGRLHSGVMNEWYGLPTVDPPPDPSYSWQESFTLFFETLLVEAESRKYDFAYTDIRAALSRAIAFFLFDDVEVPSLIWFTGSEDDIYLRLEPTPSVAAILPNVGHALWGDPLLESFFVSPTNEAMMTGYKEAGGEELIVFPRQKTKRLWYTLFLALVVLSEREPGDEKEEWARETIGRVSRELKTAPCY